MGSHSSGSTSYEQSSSPSSADLSSSRSVQTSTSSDTLQELVAEEDDPLIASHADVQRTFHDGIATWAYFLDEARNMIVGSWPADALDPYNALEHVPSLPEHLPRRDRLYGRACWKFTHDVGAMDAECGNGSKETTVSFGYRMTFLLQAREVLRCKIDSSAASFFLSNDAAFTGSLGVLVMCWSYILAARTMELQGRKIRYTSKRLMPHQIACSHSIDLVGASPALTRWLCAILNSEMGWAAQDNGRLPPWTTCFQTGTVIHILGEPFMEDGLLAPSSSEATDLLVELGRLFNLGSKTSQLPWKPLDPCEAAFLAALMIPFYQTFSLQPKFPAPSLIRSQTVTGDAHEQILRKYVADLGYFMALGIHPTPMGSILWSVFWQPDIQCNLVGPWLGSALQVLRPLLDQNKVELLLKVFLTRRPKVAMWWIGIFLLGEDVFLGWIRRYTEKLEEKYGYGSFSVPDPVISAWTGSSQTFLDTNKDALYHQNNDMVSRADLLRCRFDWQLQDTASSLLAWQPFGHIPKELIELEIWPLLELEYKRKYHCFTWYIGRKKVVDYGFRKSKGKDKGLVSVVDDLGIRSSKSWAGEIQSRITPSKESTRRMMSFMVLDATGGCNWGNAGMPFSSHKQLRWLRSWRGVDDGS